MATLEGLKLLIEDAARMNGLDVGLSDSHDMLMVYRRGGRDKPLLKISRKDAVDGAGYPQWKAFLAQHAGKS